MIDLLINHMRKKKMCFTPDDRQRFLEMAAANNQPEQFAEAILDDCNRKTPFPVGNLAEVLGFGVYLQKLPLSRLSGYLIYDCSRGRTQKLIGINAKDSFGHQRFTIAHELWHYFTECVSNGQETTGKVLSYYRTDLSDQPNEQMANTFAACLLMPRREFESAYTEYSKIASEGDITTLLSRKFQVSATAIRKRKADLRVGM